MIIVTKYGFLNKLKKGQESLTLICFKWPEKVDKEWDKDCSSPMSAKTESNQGICTDSEDKT